MKGEDTPFISGYRFLKFRSNRNNCPVCYLYIQLYATLGLSEIGIRERIEYPVDFTGIESRRICKRTAQINRFFRTIGSCSVQCQQQLGIVSFISHMCQSICNNVLGTFSVIGSHNTTVRSLRLPGCQGQFSFLSRQYISPWSYCVFNPRP